MIDAKYYLKDDCIQGAVLAINAMRQWANEHGQQLRDLAQSGTRNKGGELNKKTMDQIRPILATCPPQCQAWISSEYTHALYLDIKTSYNATLPDANGYHRAGYYKDGLCLDSDYAFEPFSLFTVEQVRADIVECKRLYEIARAADRDHHDATFKLRHFEK